jgi:hypothetical protein
MQSEHLSAEMHLDAYTPGSFANLWLSGLLHHLQLNGQPLRNTSVRIPGPSFIVYRCMLKIVPFFTIYPLICLFHDYTNIIPYRFFKANKKEVVSNLFNTLEIIQIS